MGALIEIAHVSRHFRARGLFAAARSAPVMALRAVTLTLQAGEVVGLLGESGSGKTTLARILLRLDRPSAGVVRVDGTDLATMRGEALARFRRQAQLVFQNPFEAFNPRLEMRRSLEEPLICAGISRSEYGARIALALDRARLGDLAGFLDRLPGQLSGGQLQRAAVARAIILEPRFLVADEPVSMLDVSIRAAVLGALRASQAALAFTALYISHDLNLVRSLCSRTVVLYRGAVVEDGPTSMILRAPSHPYTKALVAAVPRPRADQPHAPLPLVGSAASAPSAAGCLFRDRCPEATAICADVAPRLLACADGRRSACHRVSS
jgi:oligopeptide/dipeptide ABC transporter ATP-binding protein